MWQSGFSIFLVAIIVEVVIVLCVAHNVINDSFFFNFVRIIQNFVQIEIFYDFLVILISNPPLILLFILSSKRHWPRIPPNRK